MTEETTDISWLSCGVTEINMKREFAMGENKNRITSSKDKTGSKNKFNTEKKQVKGNKISGNNDHKQQGSRPAKAKAQKSDKCPVFGKCGGCQYLDIPYEKQLEMKQKNMEKLLSSFGYVDPIIGMEQPYFYRNKINVSFRRLKNGEIIAGIYEEGTHNVLRTDTCMIQDKRAANIIQTAAALIKSFKLQLYNEDTGTGLIRHMQIRTGFATGQILVIIVTSRPEFPSKKNFSKVFVEKCPEITTIVQNINPKKTTMVLGDRNQTIYGKGFIEDILCGNRFRISPGSFYQINPIQTEVLYNKAIKYADLKKKETVLDAYCGIGTIGISMASRAKKVIGVELSTAAIRDANKNAQINKIDNIDFYNNDAGVFMEELAEAGETIDVVCMDPPRSGSNEVFLSSLVTLSPRKVVYVSCGPESLARDLKYLTTHGYKVIKMTPVDLFPMTEHCEAVCLLSRKAAN